MEIYVQPEMLKNKSHDIKELKQQIEYTEGKLKSIRSSLDWNIKSKNSINNTFQRLEREIDTIEHTLSKHTDFLVDIANKYMLLDEQGENEASAFKDSLYSGEDSKTHSNDEDESKTFDDKAEDYVDSLAKKTIKEIVKQYSKILKELGFSKYSFGLQAGTFLYDLIAKPYELYEKYKSGMLPMSQFFVDEAKMGVDLFGGLFKTAFSLDDYLKGLHGKTPIKKISQLAKGSNFTALNTFREGLDYLPIVNVVYSAINQGVKSYNKYKQDGITSDEMIEILIDSDVKALSSVVSGLITLNLTPFGGIVYDAADSSFNLSDNLTTKIKDGAKWLGHFQNTDGKASSYFFEDLKYNFCTIGFVPSTILDFATEGWDGGMKSIEHFTKLTKNHYESVGKRYNKLGSTVINFVTNLF